MIHSGRFTKVSHVCFQAGHTYMQADHDFAIIEKAKRNCQYLYTPEDYINLVKTCKLKNKFVVHKMSQEEFLDWDVLKNHVSKRTSPQTAFSSCCYFRLTSDFRHGYGCGDTYESYELQMDTKVSIIKGRANVSSEANINLSSVPVPRRYLAPLPLNPAKLRDLRELLPGLVPKHIIDAYWKNIVDVNTSHTIDNNDDSEIVFDQVFDY